MEQSSATSTTRDTTRATAQRNWGRWGADDERGALNLLDPATVLAALGAVSRGVVYGLGTPLLAPGSPQMPGRVPTRMTLGDRTDEEMWVARGGVPGAGSNDDGVLMSTHSGSHMDALVHVYADGVHYNGIGNDAMRAGSGARRLGIEKAGAFTTRAVLLDVAGHAGVDVLGPGQVIGADDLAAVARAQGVEVRAGDVVLIRTGLLEAWTRATEAGEALGRGIPGIDSGAAAWLADRDVVAVGADTPTVEAMPFENGEFLRVHKVLLVDCGIYLMEMLDLARPAADRAWQGLLSVGPLPITGGTASPVNPVYLA